MSAVWRSSDNEAGEDMCGSESVDELRRRTRCWRSMLSRSAFLARWLCRTYSAVRFQKLAAAMVTRIVRPEKSRFAWSMASVSVSSVGGGFE